MDIIIRTAAENDADEIAYVHVNAWQSAYRGIIPNEYLNTLSVDKRAERFRNDMARYKDTYYYVAERGGAVIGNMALSRSRDEDKPKAGEIIAVYLLEQFWGRGYGRALMDYGVERLKGLGYEEIILWVLEENVSARRFYEKYGFMPDGAKKEIVLGRPLAEIRYSLLRTDKSSMKG